MPLIESSLLFFFSPFPPLLCFSNGRHRQNHEQINCECRYLPNLLSLRSTFPSAGPASLPLFLRLFLFLRLHHLGPPVAGNDLRHHYGEACKHISGSPQLLFKQLTRPRPHLKRVPTPRTQRIRLFMKYGAGGSARRIIGGQPQATCAKSHCRRRRPAADEGKVL